MINKSKLTLINLFLLLITAKGYADEQVIECPPSINLQGIQNVKVTPPDNFSVMFNPDRPLFVSGIALYDGPPEQLAELKPYNEDDNDPTWRFLDSSKQTIFVSCNYANGLIKLKKPIKKVKTCTATDTNNEVKLICH